MANSPQEVIISWAGNIWHLPTLAGLTEEESMHALLRRLITEEENPELIFGVEGDFAAAVVHIVD